MDVTINLFGDEQFRRTLRGVGERAVHLKPAYDEVGWFLMRTIKKQFDTQGGWGGEPWDALQPETVARKQRAGYPEPGRILVASGRGMESLTVFGAPGQIFDSHDDGLEFGSTTDSIVWHQPDEQGRRVLNLTGRDRNVIGHIFQRFIFHGETPLNLWGTL